MNKLFFNLRKKVANVINPSQKNSMSLPQQFLRYGSTGKPMFPDWTDVQMNDKDHYSGLGFASIYNRANAVARTSIEKVRTESNIKDYIHPYLDIIDKSPTFSNYQFWANISTFLDLEGVYYLMTIRAIDSQKVGSIQQFKLLNPYNVRRVLSSDGLEVIGYVESRNGMMREIPKEMIIEMRELNPFSQDEPFSISDAAKESQFTLKTSGDYTRHALKHNINAPGVMSTDIKLDEEDFKNFTSRVSGHTKGEPIFGNGEGSISWEGMQQELSKAALKDVSDINSTNLFAVYGVSKTIMGIEQSGTTRDTSQVQKELMFEGHISPRIQLILDSLNQDFKNKYPDDYAKSKANLIIENPFSADHNAAEAEIDLKTKQVDLFSTLIQRGIDKKTAADFVNGEVGLEELDLEPLPDVKPNPMNPPQGDTQPESPASPAGNSLQKNAIEQHGLVATQQGALQNAILTIDHQLLMNALNRIPKKIKNNIELRDKDIITEQEKNEAERDLALVLLGFYGIVVNLHGQTVMRDRIGKFAMQGQFNFDKNVQTIIKEYSNAGAASHIETISNEIYQTAKEAALQGKSLTQIQNLLKEKYTDVITQTRAKAIARSETNRAFTTAQYQADQQFVTQNELEGRAYKKFRTRSDNPCNFCQALADEPAIPLDQNFRNKGQTIEADGKTFDISYMAVEAGNVHTNCSCEYEFILMPE